MCPRLYTHNRNKFISYDRTHPVFGGITFVTCSVCRSFVQRLELWLGGATHLSRRLEQVLGDGEASISLTEVYSCGVQQAIPIITIRGQACTRSPGSTE